MGKPSGGGRQDQAAGAAAATQARISEQLFSEATGLRQSLLQTGEPTEGLIGGILEPLEVEPTPLRPISPVGRETTEQQFDIARRNILGTVPRGGRQAGLLRDIEIGRAGEVSRQGAEVEQQLFERDITDIARREQAEQTRAGRIFQAAQPALGPSQIGIGGLGQAGGILGGLAGVQAQRQQATAGLVGQLGSGLGLAAGLSSAGKKAGSAGATAGAFPAVGALVCWIARALYGRHSIDAYLARYFRFTLLLRVLKLPL